MDRYFQKLPNLYYNNYLVKDISRRAKIVEEPRKSPFVFYPYEIKHQLRSDHIAEYYYNDSELDWLIYMSNEIIDPYYDWYLNDFQFESLLIQKYGSIEQAQKKIIFYRNNWAIDDTELSVSYYNNTLTQSWKKYYSPNWGPGNKIVSYRRKQLDALTNTNRIIEYAISANNTANGFVAGELVDIKIPGQDATVGTGEVIIANSTIVRIKNVDGNTSANSTFNKTIVGETTFANVTVSNSDVTFQNFTTDEGVFWNAVSYFDYETEINEQKKNIRLVGSGQHLLLVDQFQQRMSEDVDSATNLSTNTT
jgi:hypothetical protein